MNNVPVIAVDGPSGSGKGTLSQLLAKTLKWHFLDSGALYRVLGLFALKRQVNLEEDTLAQLAGVLPVRFGNNNEDFNQVWLEDEDVTRELRTETTGYLASTVAKLPLVREALLKRQRDFQKPPGLVADGRDMGTVVFPTANLKFFLEADPNERAKRRFLQLQGQGLDVSLDNLLTEINERDKQDKNRKISPLKPAQDAIILDTTRLNIEAVYQEVMQVIQSRFPMWLLTAEK